MKCKRHLAMDASKDDSIFFEGCDRSTMDFDGELILKFNNSDCFFTDNFDLIHHFHLGIFNPSTVFFYIDFFVLHHLHFHIDFFVATSPSLSHCRFISCPPYSRPHINTHFYPCLKSSFCTKLNFHLYKL